jgi:undecaprenyl-diphosphatase
VTLLQSIVLAIVEGLTEFLPVSSTGHLIITSSLMGIGSLPFTKLFMVSIQLGAIMAVVVLYWKNFFKSLDFYFKIGVAFIPAVVAGLLLFNYIEVLLERVDVVGFSLILGGIFFLFMDKIFQTEDVPQIGVSYSTAFKIGMFQIIAMVPGVSRSAATIIGGLSQNLTRKSAAEFSFFLAVPTMFAATVLSLYDFQKSDISLTPNEIFLLIIGNIVAFIVAVFAIKSFIQFLTNHGFKFFGYYRIALGAVILILYYIGVDFSIL